MGLFEEGMAMQEMRDLLHTIKQSEQSAHAEKEYRETLEKTKKNVNDLLEIMSDTKNKDPGYNLRRRFNTKDHTDTSLGQDPSEIETVREIDVKSVTEDKSDSESMLISQSSEENSVLQNVKEVKTVSQQDYRNIDVFSCNRMRREALKIIENNNDYLEPFYCRPEILRLPLDLRVKAIRDYHNVITVEYKHRQSKSVNIVTWGPFIPCPIGSQEAVVVTKENNGALQNLPEEKRDNYISLRPRRHIKRKYYNEANSDSDDEIISLKKSREAIKSGL